MARSTKKPIKKATKGSSRKPAVRSAKKAALVRRSKSAPAPTREHDSDRELFAVTATDIERLDDGQFRRFMRELLRNEVEACTGARFIDNPGDSNDLGQDAETRRPSDNITADPFIPVGTTVWQYKAEKKSPSESDFVREIDKPRPKEVLKARGNYRYVAQQPRENESVKDALLRKVATSKRYSAKQVAFTRRPAWRNERGAFPHSFSFRSFSVHSITFTTMAGGRRSMQPPRSIFRRAKPTWIDLGVAASPSRCRALSSTAPRLHQEPR